VTEPHRGRRKPFIEEIVMKLRQTLLIALLCSTAAVLPAAAGPRQLACSAGTQVDTRSGPVCGVTVAAAGGPVDHYLGIPYAAPPVVAQPPDISACEAVTPSLKCLRFKPPQPPAAWTEVLQATAFGPACPQPNAGEDTDESCLFLNVYRPQGASKRPVMVFIHGGAFYLGTSSIELFDGAALARTGNLVVVDFNYRLGALGFLAAKDGMPQHSLTGNYGFLDQQFALQWVQDNIAAFGGDPAEVTIFGQSAGAMSVGLHLVAAPASRNLFRAAIMESNPLGNIYQTPDEMAGYQGNYMTGALGCQANDVSCLYTAHAADIVAAEKNVPLRSGGLSWAPVLDGADIDSSSQPIEHFSGIEKPLLFGTTHDEGTYFINMIWKKPVYRLSYLGLLEAAYGKKRQESIAAQYPCKAWTDCRPQLAQIETDSNFTCANRYAAERATRTAPVWGYQFNALSGFWWPLTPTCANQGPCPCAGAVCHSAELPYLFGTPNWIKGCGADHQSPCSFGAGQQQLSQSLMGFWTGFATNLQPADAGTWPKFDRYLLLGADSASQQITTSGADPFAASCCLWENFGIYGPPSPGCQQQAPSSGWKKGRS
jgi:carboxylesterase type B